MLSRETLTGLAKKFIDYSQNGIVVEPLEMFVNFLLSGEYETKFPLMDLIQVGKSSGIDASIGAIIATGFVLILTLEI